MVEPMKSTERRGRRAAILALAARGLIVVSGVTVARVEAAQPKGKIDCSKYTGTEKEACEKMTSRRRS